MKKLIPIALLTAAFVCAAEVPKAEVVLEKALAATGGEAYANAKSAVMTGTVELVGHALKGSIEIYEQDPDMYSVIELPGLGKIEQGMKGDVAWEANAIQGARLIEGEEKKSLDRASRMTFLKSWKDSYKAVRNLGEEKIGDRAAWKVEMTPTEGAAELMYFDQQTYLILRMTQKIDTQFGELEADSLFSDYKAVDGVMTPFTLTQKTMNQQMLIRIDKASYNLAIPADRFVLPDPVKALLAKKK